LEADFALYPAVSWPHKNHVRLLEALAHLRDRAGLRIPLVCTGSRYEEFWPHIERRTRDLGLGSQVKFLGFVPEEELRAIYRMALFLVQPSLFEASSLPMFEAWLEGVPVTCANVTALPEQAMDAALLFEPTQVSAIAEAMSKMACDAGLRHDLCVRGYERLKYFDWDLTAKTYRAVYRRIGRIDLTDEDRWLLGRNSLREPSQQMGIVRER
jgi:glycosyltransferase involved in cell wall biosynthesis